MPRRPVKDLQDQKSFLREFLSSWISLPLHYNSPIVNYYYYYYYPPHMDYKTESSEMKVYTATDKMVGQWRRSCHPQKHNNSNNNTRPTIAQYSIPKKDSFYTWIPYTRLGTTNRASHKAHMNKTIHIIRVVLSFEFIKSSAISCVIIILIGNRLEFYAEK